MPRTNVDYYMTGFDAAGKRVGSLICDFDPDKNPKKLAALKEKAAELFTDAVVIEVTPTEDYNLYLDGCVRGVDGKPVPYVPPEPTAEEKAAMEKAALKAEYETNKKEMLDALQAASLAGNAAAVESIQNDYKDMTTAYKEAVEGVEA
nr:hypothetical protein [Acidaminococcus intestini]